MCSEASWHDNNRHVLTPGAGAVTVDARGRVSTWSTRAEQLLGYPAGDVLGRRAADLLAAPVPASVRRYLTERAEWSGTFVIRHRDGTPISTRIRAFPQLDAQGADSWILLLAEPPNASASGADASWERSFSQLPVALLIHDAEARVTHANAEALRLLELREDVVLGHRIDEFRTGSLHDDLAKAVVQVIRTGEPIRTESSMHTTGANRPRTWSLVISPLEDAAGRLYGAATTAREITEPAWARWRLSVVNEASIRIGTTLEVVRTAEELAELAVERLADFAAVDLLDPVYSGEEPKPGWPADATSMRRAANRSVLDSCPEAVFQPGELSVFPESSPLAEALAEGRAARYGWDEPSVRDWLKDHRDLSSKMSAFGMHSVMLVPIRARETPLGFALFARHRTPEPFDDDDLLLAEEITARAAVCVDNARRYTRERKTSLALQQSLLPQSAPREAAVEVASRYLPAGSEAGIGGDWFDVIPLSGARVALVVGDVVGHGIHASATMGRLRMAVRTLADVDLPPDELLTHLDDLVLRLDRAQGEVEGEVRSQSDGDVGATCLYAVYDPVLRRCTVARAGHPPPVLVHPDGTAGFLDLPAGPPLGIGGLPFESAVLDVPEGSLLVLYTDGLVEASDRDIDATSELLRRTLAAPGQSLERMCDTILERLLPDHPVDDVALLLARTRALDSSRVATWDLRSDPAIVATARSQAVERLMAWGLEECAFVTELVVSELVTNAIRYGEEPIRLRLIRDRALICEVTDGGNTSPHLRRARTFDEGGRGLLLVAQLTDHWGTRHTTRGKTVWAEQGLPGPL
ncbi:SpoIIE family protein phosphatase [Streptomyces sp. NBC_01352]|uniref:SpoIIE family protein phosphatase n=1 Tax=Streptomyces sp. NBC_01352 TaxID=2903834 RepID=UPI00225C3A78|nr:SpoIIE family protein phosphatase [Streptomyces sp. NBC_01373]